MISLDEVWDYNYNQDVSYSSYKRKVESIVDNMDYKTQGFFKSASLVACSCLNILDDVLRDFVGLRTVEMACLSDTTGIIILDRESELLCKLILDIGNYTTTQFDDDYLLDDSFSFQSPVPRNVSCYLEDIIGGK